ncbi:transposase [Aromatoleum aromaticum]|nr:transposase [Aromatoleum aromaticum]
MKKKRFSVEQIVAILKQAELRMPVADVVRQVGVSEQTFYRWKKLYSGLQSDPVRELKQLQDENSRLKKLVADLSLGSLAGGLVKKISRPALKRTVVAYVMSSHGYSERRACRLTTRVRQLRSQVLVFARAHFQKCHYNSANCSGAAGFPIPKA